MQPIQGEPHSPLKSVAHVCVELQLSSDSERHVGEFSCGREALNPPICTSNEQYADNRTGIAEKFPTKPAMPKNSDVPISKLVLGAHPSRQRGDNHSL